MAKLFIVRGRIFYEDSDKLSLLNGAILDSETTAAAGSQTINDLDAITSGSTVYDPASVVINKTIDDLDAIASGSTVYDPAGVSLGGATQTINDLDAIASGSTAYDPTVVINKTIDDLVAISSSSIVYDPAYVGGPAQIISDLTAIASGSTVYDISTALSNTINLGFISGTSIYNPTIVGGIQGPQTYSISKDEGVLKIAISKNATTKAAFSNNPGHTKCSIVKNPNEADLIVARVKL